MTTKNAAHFTKLLSSFVAATCLICCYFLGSDDLIAASKLGDIDSVKALLKNNASVDQPDARGWTPLYWASQFGHSQVVTILIENGAKANRKTKEGITPLFIASKYGHDMVVSLNCQFELSI